MSFASLSFCNSIMRAVVAAGAVDHSNIDQAVEVMRQEVKDLLFAPRYQGERELVILNAAHERVVLGIVVAECIAKLRGASR